MKNKFEIYAVRLMDKNVVAIKTELPDIVSIERMKSLISVDGYTFFANVNGVEHEFKFDNDSISEPSFDIIKQINQF